MSKYWQSPDGTLHVLICRKCGGELWKIRNGTGIIAYCDVCVKAFCSDCYSSNARLCEHYPALEANTR